MKCGQIIISCWRGSVFQKLGSLWLPGKKFGSQIKAARRGRNNITGGRNILA